MIKREMSMELKAKVGSTKMCKIVIKRDGTKVKFERAKIGKAILKAYNEVYPDTLDINTELANDICSYVCGKLKTMLEISVEDIQDIVETTLMDYDRNVAKAYITYRYKRSLVRQSNTTDKSILELIDGVNDYWNNENSNKNATLATTQRDYLAGITSTDISQRFLLPLDVVEAHKQGIIHFHDMDYFAEHISNCCLVNLEDMLQNGTMINRVKIEKPHRLITATTIATQIITAVASSQYGGTSITLTHLAPFVRDSYIYHLNKYKDRGLDYDKSVEFARLDTKKEIEDSVQTFNYQINSMSTTNGQTPFLTVFMYLGETNEYKEELAALIKEFIKQRILGLKNENGVYVTPAFPKLIYVLEKDNITEDSRYWDITVEAAKCTAKRLVPDYISEKKMKELKESNCFPSMGCRSFLAPYKDENDNYKFYGRFNQGVVTINLVDVALSSNRDINKFWQLFEERTELCHKALRCRHERLKGTLSDVAPILWQDGAFTRLKKGEKIDKYLYGGYSSISLGYAGLYECVKYMTGHSHTDSSVGEKFGLEVMERLNKKCEQWTSAENIGYSL